MFYFSCCNLQEFSVMGLLAVFISARALHATRILTTNALNHENTHENTHARNRIHSHVFYSLFWTRAHCIDDASSVVAIKVQRCIHVLYRIIPFLPVSPQTQVIPRALSDSECATEASLMQVPRTCWCLGLLRP